MYRLILFLLIFFCNLLFGMDNSEILSKQLPNENVDSYLIKKVPYLRQQFTTEDFAPVSSENQYVLQFNPSELSYHYFSKVTGCSIFNAKFVVSWYLFTNVNDIPNSSEQMLYLVNKSKPLLLKSMTSVDGKWLDIVDLPYESMSPNTFVFAYVSYPNSDGVLVPLGGQSFYREFSSTYDNSQEQSMSLNDNILSYWKDKEYL